jgi:phytoene desaturase
VIGSGFGGIAAAIRLQALGVQTTLFEARDKPGGRAYVYRDQGFTFDAGPTVITAPECLEELFALTGCKLSDHVELLPVTPFYRLLWDDGDRFDYVADSEQMRAQIGARDPRDAEGYSAFVEYTRRVFQKGYTELAAKPFLRFFDMVRVAPELALLRADRSVYDTVARYVRDPHVREALSFHSLLVGGNPFDTSAIYTLIHYLERRYGVWFPRGGTGALVNALVERFQGLGGDQTVHQVRTDAHGEEAFELVVSNADLHHTYATLYQGLESAAKTATRLERADWSMSLFVLYFGTDIPYDLAHHTVIFGPRYEALLREIFDGPELPRDFSLYLHAPTVTDPSLAPPGCGSHYVLSPVPHLGKANIDWNAEAPRYARKIVRALERHMPNLSQHIVTQRWFTPLDFQSTLNAFHGSAFSIAPTLAQSAYFRPHNRDPKIPGLFIVGAGTHPGAGLPGVINSAKATVSLIAQQLGLEVAA